MSEQNFHHEFNCAVLGSAEVGKTALCKRFCGATFKRANHKPSFDAEPMIYSVECTFHNGCTKMIQ